MNSRLQIIRILLLVSYSLTSFLNASTEYDNLIEKSPFLPKGFNSNNEKEPAAPTVQNKMLEFKSMVKLNNEWRFSVLEKNTGKSYWLTKAKSSPVAELLDYNINSRTVTLSISGRTETLSLSKPTFNTSPSVPIPTTMGRPGLAKPPIPSQRISNKTTSQSGGSRKPIVRRRIIRPTNR